MSEIERPDPLAEPEFHRTRPMSGVQAPVHKHSLTCMLETGHKLCGQPSVFHVTCADLQEHIYETDYCKGHYQFSLLGSVVCLVCKGAGAADYEMRQVRAFSLDAGNNAAGTVTVDSVQHELDRVFGDDHDD